MNNNTVITSMPEISAEMNLDVDSQGLIQAISTAITNGFSNLNTLQVDAINQIETNRENIETNTQDIGTNTQNLTTINNSIGDFITPIRSPQEPDLNNYLKTGVYTADFTGYTNYPATHPYALLEVIAGANYVRQTLTLLGENEKILYVRMYASGVWRSWRSYKSVDTLPMEQIITFSSSSNCTLTVSNYWRGEIVLMGGNADQMGYYLCRVSSAGNPYVYAMKNATNVTITSSTNSIVLSSSDVCGGYVKTVTGTCVVS